ncbi:TerD family protein OS=Streptomyces rimosus subsp. rimosus (strain ATCC / DSM 40260 / JCM 4667/ NRRL 2234) OX=1265868 GN=SRIM_022475 PE=3 SV=1 [Streptomyces rimosus subsp. rimosus]
MQTFTEVALPNGDTPRRPERGDPGGAGGKAVDRSVETKTNGNPLKSEQVQDYMDIAARRGYEAVIALSTTWRWRAVRWSR